jgi:glutaminase
MTDLQSVLDEIAQEAQVRDHGPGGKLHSRNSPRSMRSSSALPSPCRTEPSTLRDTRRPGFRFRACQKCSPLLWHWASSAIRVWSRVGREPSGNPFNSIVQLEQEKGRPRNPFINAGAIAVADLIMAGHQPKEAIGEIIQFIRHLADDDSILIDEQVARSETAHGDRNASLAHFMRSFGNIDHPVDHVLGVYFHQCALVMNCRQLSRAGTVSGQPGARSGDRRAGGFGTRARRINAIMLMCGHYDGSGEFAFRVGLPGKSGVGGGILAIAPGKASIAVWSPGLDRVGNSKLGTAALEQLARRMGWSVFGA